MNFRFSVARKSIARSISAGVAVSCVLPLWAWSSGRLVNVDVAFITVVAGCILGAAAWVGWRTVRANTRLAHALGSITVDARGVRWSQPDGTVPIDASWDSIAGATLDRQLKHVLFHRPDEAPLLIGYGSGFVSIERLDEFELELGAHVTVRPHVGERDPKAARLLVLLGTAGVGLAAALYAADSLLRGMLRWPRSFIATPIFLGVVALVLIFAGIRIGLGRGPLVSPLYAPGYWKVVARFYVVLTLAHFVLLAVFNWGAR